MPRSRLLADDEGLRRFPAILVQAPPGFGKTSLLAQWRLEHLAHGSVVAWLSAQAQDDPQRLAQSLALAVRQGSGRQTFAHTLLEGGGPGGPGGADGLGGITVWLAEMAQSAIDMVLVVDEAERLPKASREALAYLLRNAPPNLRTIVAARPDIRFDIDDLIAYGQCAELGAGELRFRLEETLELVRARLGSRFDHDSAARLHALTEGWPLGLQLALTILGRGGDVAGMAALDGALHDHFVKLLVDKLDAADRDFLARIAILDDLHPELCRAVSGHADSSERLARLSRDTPVFAAAERGDWLRMHTLARDVLRQRFAEMPAAEQSQAHARAAEWLAEHGLLEPAARHALTAGQTQRAYELAERSLYESLMRHGRHGTVLEWLAQLPAAELDRRPRLLLAAAWTLAISERHEEAQRLVARILAQPQVDERLHCECALILGSAAVFADLPDRFVELHAPWADYPLNDDPMLQQVQANRTAYRALLEGEPALARLRQQQAPRGEFGHGVGFLGRWGELIIGLSYLWEGQALLADPLLRPSVARAEAELGRRNGLACMLAALLAAAAWECDRPADAAALLADRLDVLERGGLPECLLLAYRTLARLALSEGAEHRALELLGALDAAGAARQLPRLGIASLSEQVILHARRYRAQSCRELVAQIDARLDDPDLPVGVLWRRRVDLLADQARAYAAIAAQDWRGALPPLARADEAALQLKQGRLHIEMLGLRAFALDRCGEDARALLREATDLAQAHGLRRVFVDAHPDLGAWVQAQIEQLSQPAAAANPPPAAAPPVVPRPPVVGPGMVLTPKEREVLELLARNLSNKEIGNAMQVGETTIKWHVKNLFAKLDAGSRKQVVQRARILGLIGATG
ncbi:LuxR C-terminal-related transcriptional regulator [Variovorax sp. OV329]|uniref:LuxR C-terminal-related transcriptional regulator n=1 Tax=Variovorax sp. OV329 TaxID=1882825 RepID=UPI0020C8D935|nr:LuxR C-terminal-related transcriptional regulator [Variovorax sp. OV329]